MDSNHVKRASSAGYRLPERACETGPTDRTRGAGRGGGGGGGGGAEQNPDRRDPVKQDRVWTEVVQSERRGVREWEKNWNFLRNYDQMGQPRWEEPLPSSVSLFSDRVPNTSSQMFGSRLSTPLGSDVVRLDRMSLRTGSHRKSARDPEIQPC